MHLENESSRSLLEKQYAILCAPHKLGVSILHEDFFITLAFKLYTALSKEEMIKPWVGVDFSSLLRIHFGKSQKQEDENS